MVNYNSRFKLNTCCGVYLVALTNIPGTRFSALIFPLNLFSSHFGSFVRVVYGNHTYVIFLHELFLNKINEYFPMYYYLLNIWHFSFYSTFWKIFSIQFLPKIQMDKLLFSYFLKCLKCG